MFTLTHSLTHSLNYLLTHLLTHSLPSTVGQLETTVNTAVVVEGVTTHFFQQNIKYKKIM